MAIKSISDLFNFSLFIFDLDNTIYNEEDYLFQGYKAIADKFAPTLPSYDNRELHNILKDLYMKEGREKLFDKFLDMVGLERDHISECLYILRTFKPEKPLLISREAKNLLMSLKSSGKSVFILTNGNPEQQRNKVNNIFWDSLDEQTGFIFADEHEPKPSPAGVLYILKTTGIDKSNAIFIGDSENDRLCAENSEISYLDIRLLPELTE